MTEAELIKQKRAELSRDEWISMMQKRKAMQAEGKTPKEIVKALK